MYAEPLYLYQWDFLMYNSGYIVLKGIIIRQVNLRMTSSLLFESCPKISSLEKDNKDILNK